MSTPRDTFVAKTLALGSVWALQGADEDWAICEFNHGEFDAMLLWPEEKAAKACAIGEWKGYKPTAIVLHDYVESWLPAMQEDGIRVNINYGLKSRGTVVAADELADAYRAAQSQAEPAPSE